MPPVEAGTALYGVIGWPLRNTLSPQLHNSAFTALGLKAVYVPLRVPPDRARDLGRALETLGVAGANVTVPHKEAAFRQCHRLSAEAAAARSVNTLVRTRQGWEGHTTDGTGFLDFLGATGLPRARVTVALLGAGGAARSIAAALGVRPGVRLRIISRDPRRAARDLRGLKNPGRGSSVEFLRRGSPDARRAIETSGLVLNATPLGSGTLRALPCPPEWVGRAAAAVDLVYGLETPWRRALRRRGCVVFSGLGMLIHQAARSFELWTGQKALSWMMWTGGWEDELEHSGAAARPSGGAGHLRR